MKDNQKRERLNEAVIGEGLSIPVFVLNEVDSTNTEARRRILSEESMPQMILAERQSAGRGRQGKSFFSPPDAGIYLSFAFPVSDGGAPLLLTTSAAVATMMAIRRVTGVTCGIKWVNDLYLRERKVAGILAESLFVGERRFVIVGVGVNLYPSDFPAELSGIAGSVLADGSGLRNALAAELCRSLAPLAEEALPRGFMEIYRAHSIVLGKDVVYLIDGERREGVAEDIDDCGRLLVRGADGFSEWLASGEITLRPKDAEDRKKELKI